jgi:hypothetical protein
MSTCAAPFEPGCTAPIVGVADCEAPWPCGNPGDVFTHIGTDRLLVCQPCNRHIGRA